MLKKKKKNSQEEEVTPQQELAEEIGHVNESRVNHKDDEESVEDKLKKENTELNDKYLRLYAEFDNYKRRTTKERIELLQTAGKDVIVDLLPVLDDFERALKAMESASDVTSVKTGVELVHNKLKNLLTQKGLKEMNASGQTFDADLHEAVTNIPAPSDDLKGKNLEELEKGYYLNDKVIRFAKVVVGA